MSREDYDYEYDYHNLADNSEDLIEDDEYYQDSGDQEPWMGMNDDEDDVMDDIAWDNYYHNIADEIADD